MSEPAVRGTATPNLDTLLRQTVRQFSQRPALVFSGEEISYRDLDRAVDAIASRLESGSRVGIIAPTIPALAVAQFAAWRAGCVAVPLSARLREYEIAGVLQDAAVHTIISIPVYRGYSFERVLPEMLPQLPTVRSCVLVDQMGAVEDELSGPGERAESSTADIAAILYTSGTTGKPKGAMVSHQRELNGARALAEILRLAPDDRSLFVIPISHAFGLTCYLASVASGGTGVLIDSTFSPEPMLAAIETQAATILHGSPAVFSAYLKAASQTTSLRSGLVAGAPCPPTVLRALDRRGIEILNLYGMTEIGPAACCDAGDPADRRYTTVGRPLPGYSFRTVDGEIQVRGTGVMPGYFRQPVQTAQSFDHGWFRTGDLGSIDADRYIRISGRTKEVVQVAGLSVFPAEVEGFLATHPDVTEAVIIGVPHDTMGEALEAFVVPRPGTEVTGADVLRFARPRIAGYKLPYTIHVVPEVPRLASGKPDRLALRRRREEDGRVPGADTHAPL